MNNNNNCLKYVLCSMLSTPLTLFSVIITPTQSKPLDRNLEVNVFNLSVCCFYSKILYKCRLRLMLRSGVKDKWLLQTGLCFQYK